MKRLVYIIAASMLLASCGSLNQASQITRSSQYSQMYEEKPTTLLVMPPINNTSFVEAKEFLYTSINKPLIEAGYYVVSPKLAMEILKAESAYDAELFVDKPLTPFLNVFGADAVIFCEINSWTKAGFGVKTNIRYFIKSVRTNTILFDRTCDLYLDLSINSANNNSVLGALVNLAASAINTAATDHIVAARNANYYIFKDIPRGKYSPDYQLDQNYAAEERDINVTVK